jgi:glycerol-3-phosphate dehydrogenase
LRYLEHGAFGLVREGLAERAVMLKTAPHIIWPARFVLPHHAGLRPAWQLRLGLLIYDLLAGKNLLPSARGINLGQDEAGTPLKAHYRKAFEYSDACVDDSRLVVLNAVDAALHGAAVFTRTRFEGAVRKDGHWEITLQGKAPDRVMARALINASGPWIESVNGRLPPAKRAGVNLVKGSHIVVRKLFDHAKAYIFQNRDGRIVFAIPYQRDFTLLGTTDIPFTGDAVKAAASDEEISYLCALANDYFRKGIVPKDVVWSFAGVRALYDNRSLREKDLSRDYFLETEAGAGKAPLLSIYGGKLTAARHLAEKVLEKLEPHLPMGPAWTAQAPFPGGDFEDVENEIAKARARWKFLSEPFARRLIRAYGTRIEKILGAATCMEDLGMNFGADLTESEVRYLMKEEWAQTPDDILWRRSKLGLHLSKPEQEALARFMETA